MPKPKKQKSTLKEMVKEYEKGKPKEKGLPPNWDSMKNSEKQAWMREANR